MLSEEEKKAIDFLKNHLRKKIPPYWYDDTIANIEEKIKTILNLIKKQQAEIEKKDNIINRAIEEVEKEREYFSEDLQPEFIGILEILKDKKVIDW